MEKEELQTIKLKFLFDLPQNYSGIVEWEEGAKSWYKHRFLHREDGPAKIYKDGYKSWWLDGNYIWDSENKLDFTNKTIISKTTDPKYPLVQVWKIKNNKNGKIRNQIMIPGMEDVLS